MGSRLRPRLVLTLLWALYFHPLFLNPIGVLYSDYSDFLAEHLPAKLFLNREWRQGGELPLWNPYHFAGSPFVHDIQVGTFYPPYAVTYLVPEAAVGPALTWVIALHVLAAGLFMHGYARSRGLCEAGALTAAAVFMLSPKWLAHLVLAGQTILVGMAWLPLVLWGWERAAATRRFGPAVGAGIALALVGLGTLPQWAFYGGLFAVAWTFGNASSVRTWLLMGAVIGLIAVALMAVQLAPTWEASQLSSRAGGLEATGSLAIGYRTFFALVGPALTYSPPWPWEGRGLFGAVALATALAAPKLVGPAARWPIGVLLAMVFFSIGGAALVEWLPGFSSFRVPSRMLVTAALPVAVLAGMSVDALERSNWSAEVRTKLRTYLGMVTVLAVVPSLAFAGLAWREGGRLWVPGAVGWVGLFLGLAGAAWACRPNGTSRGGGVVFVSSLLVEVLTASALFPEVRPQTEIFPQSDAVRFLSDHLPQGSGRVLDRDVGDGSEATSLLGVGSPLASCYGIESVRGYNPLDVLHYREYLGFLADDAGPHRGNSPLTQQIVPSVPLSNPHLADLLGVKYLVGPADLLPPPHWQRVFVDLAPYTVPPLPTPPPTRLPPHAIYENHAAFPRAFIVSSAEPMPSGQELAALKACDFRKTVLLAPVDPFPTSPAGSSVSVLAVEHRSNRVVVRVSGGGGFLVLCEVWFPGWACHIDGRPAPIYRANHAFRAVALPADAKEIVFTFVPRSYSIGWWVSVTALVGVGLFWLRQLTLRTGSGVTSPSSRE